mgnify:CR=1 FL=1
MPYAHTADKHLGAPDTCATPRANLFSQKRPRPGHAFRRTAQWEYQKQALTLKGLEDMAARDGLQYAGAGCRGMAPWTKANYPGALPKLSSCA